MLERRPHQDSREGQAHACHGRLRARFLLTLGALALSGAGEILAADGPFDTSNRLGTDERPVSPPSSASMSALPETYWMPNLPEPKSFSTKDFRPRGHSLLDTHFSVADDALIDDTSAWQRLSEYRTRDRVQVLTLWKSRASTVSLQAGRHGSPSLQWTSTLMNRGGATRGLLDRLFPVSALSESSTASHSVSHAASSQPTGKGVTAFSISHPGNSGTP
jgi:hypothetical protein